MSKFPHITPHIGHEPSDDEQREALDRVYGEMKGVRSDAERKPPEKKFKPVDHKSKGRPAPGRQSPVTAFVRNLGDYHTTCEVAEILGVSESLIRKLSKEKVTQAPSYVAPFGKIYIYLYTKEDITVLKDHMKRRHEVVMPREQFEEE